MTDPLTCALGLLRWAALLPLGLFGLVLVGAWMGHRSLGKTIRKLGQTACPACGVPFGEPAVCAAQAAWGQEFQRLAAANPGILLRVLAAWPLGCPGCGARFSFRPGDGQLLPARSGFGP